MDKQIIYYYGRGVASYQIAKHFGVSNTYVRSVLKKNGIKLRGHEVTNKMSAARRTPEENAAITKKAAEANLGSVHTATHRAKLALARERKPTIDPVYEQPLVDLAQSKGIKVVPQKAFARFNVDLYFVAENVVVEIFGGGFHNKKDAVQLFQNKIDYLSRNKVPVLIVWADQLTYSPENVLRIVSDLKLRPTKLSVITGDGKPSTRGLGDIILNY